MSESAKGKLIEKKLSDYVIFDLETTGISCKTDDVIEISAIKVKNHVVQEEFTTLVNPGRKIPYGATAVNGITDKMVKDAPDFKKALSAFLRFTGKLPLVGHNIASFDMNFLYRDSLKFFGQYPENDYLDTLKMAKKVFPDMKHRRLVDLAEHYGIATDGAHRALNDCRMNQIIFERMMGNSEDKHPLTSVTDTKEKKVDSAHMIRGVVERITYQNPENGYTVLKCAVKNESDLVTVVGNLLDVNVGSVLLIQGSWKIDSKFGRQFMAEKWEETLPATIFGIEKYLGSGLIKGVGPKYAKKIVMQFGTDTIEILDNDSARLLEVEGIGKKRVKQITESWGKQKEIKNIMLFLQEHEVSTSYAAKIYRQYGNDSIKIIQENPYRLADDIWGIGFRTADIIAGKLGFQTASYHRLRSGILYTMNRLADDGHVFARREQLIEKACELLGTEDAYIIMTLDHMLKDQDLILEEIDEEDALYLPPFYYAEIGITGNLRRLSTAQARDKLWVNLEEARQKSGNSNISIDISFVQNRLGMMYDDIQADAIRRAASSKILILTGGPGTGKTTTTQGIIAAYQAFGMKILLAAPTGRAAKRMTEATGLEAKTIHRLLEYKPPEGYQKDAQNPLEGDVLIVDECSMIDVILMNALLKAIPDHMRLILIGDIDQLPSVGAGNVLRDLIDSDCFPVVCLTRIFRQAQSSRIITNAHKINQGEFPDISNGSQTDFFFMNKEDPDEVVKTIVELVQTKLSRYYQISPAQIQVLTPMQKGIVGAANLNLSLQAALNPEGDGLRKSGYIFRVNDKVMQIKNNYDKEVFNGDIGTVISVNVPDRTLEIEFDGRKVVYDATELDELVHAYATTIHKSQGSEYPIVVMPVLMNHYVMLQRNLLYTGITRAKKILVLVGTRRALQVAVQTITTTKRNTSLKERIKKNI